MPVNEVQAGSSSSPLLAALRTKRGAPPPGVADAAHVHMSNAARKRPMMTTQQRQHQPVSDLCMQSDMQGGVRLAAPAYSRGKGDSSRVRDVHAAARQRAADIASSTATPAQIAALEVGLVRAAQMTELGASSRTLSKDDHAWEFWQDFSAKYGWDPIVTRVDAVSRPDALAARLGLFTLWTYPQIQGRMAPDAKPSVVFTNYPGAIARVLKRDFKLPVPPAKTYEGETKGLLRSYAKVYGTLALATRKRQPITPGMWQRVENLKSGDALPGRQPWMTNAHDDLTVVRLGRVLRKTAHRLGEIVSYLDSEITYLTRANATFCIGGVVYVDPDEATLRRMRIGDVVYIAPCASKPDQFGEDTCPFPSVLEFTGMQGCAATAVRDIFLERPCHGMARHTTPLFATQGGRPYSYGTLNRLLHKLIAALFGEAVASVISWHSFRIWLAIALREANCPDEMIQLICRWKCKESLQAYAQVGSARNIEWLRRAEHSLVDVVRTANLPALDNEISLAYLAGNQPAAPTRARATRADAAAPMGVGPPLLTAGERVEVLWGDTYYAGAFTSSRRGVNTRGHHARLHRIVYDAGPTWAAHHSWHDLDLEQWRRV